MRLKMWQYYLRYSIGKHQCEGKDLFNVTIKSTVCTGSGLLSHLGQFSGQWLSNSVWSLLQKAMFAFMVNAAYIHSIVNDLSISLPHISSIPLPCLPWGKSPEVIHSRANITAAQKLCLSPSVPPVSPTPRSALVKYSSLSADSSVLLQKQSSYLIIHWFDNQRISSLNERWC